VHGRRRIYANNADKPLEAERVYSDRSRQRPSNLVTSEASSLSRWELVFVAAPKSCAVNASPISTIYWIEFLIRMRNSKYCAAATAAQLWTNSSAMPSITSIPEQCRLCGTISQLVVRLHYVTANTTHLLSAFACAFDVIRSLRLSASPLGAIH